MLNRNLNRGDIVKLPQSVVLYNAFETGDSFSLSFREKLEIPRVAIFVESFNSVASKLILEDKFVYVYNEALYEVENGN